MHRQFKFVQENIIWLLPLCIMLSLMVGIIFGMRIGRHHHHSGHFRPSRAPGYKYISPLLTCNYQNSENEDSQLEAKLTEFLNKTPADTVSVYYQDLTAGNNWAGINVNETYAPASMMKVPVMAAILKYTEMHPDFLHQKIYYDGSFDNNAMENVKPLQPLEPKQYYSVDELLTHMISYSDNNAAGLLIQSIDRTSLGDIFLNIGVQLPPTDSDFMSVKTYSMFLRLLYNSTYLSRAMSEKAIALLAASDFPQGLRASVPSSIQIAQKYGERVYFDKSGSVTERELHDCGIVYAPKGPYVLCVMTRGKDFSSLLEQIKGVSKIVYDYTNE